jgi:hypothetical protein
MNRKQLAFLFVLLVVLGAAGLFLQRGGLGSSQTGGSGTGAKLLGDKVPLDDIVHISIKLGTNELNLVKKDDLWRVRERNDYPANFGAISELVNKIANLKAVQTEQVGPSQLARFQLAPPGQGSNAGVQLDLKDKADKTIRALTLGKPHLRKPSAQQSSQLGDSEGFPDGRWVTVAGKTQDVFLVGEPLESVDVRPGPWLNKDFFKIERPKAVSVTFEAATNSWKLARDTETGEWKLADLKPGEALDTNKIYGLTAPFAAPTFTDVAPSSAKPEEHGLDKPTVVTVETFDDFTYTVKVGSKTGEDTAMTVAVVANFPKERASAKDEKPDEKEKADKAWKERETQLTDKLKQMKAFENWIYLVPTYSVDQILKERKDLLVEKKEEPKPDDKGATGLEKKDDAGSATNVPEPAVIKQ